MKEIIKKLLESTNEEDILLAISLAKEHGSKEDLLTSDSRFLRTKGGGKLYLFSVSGEKLYFYSGIISSWGIHSDKITFERIKGTNPSIEVINFGL